MDNLVHKGHRQRMRRKFMDFGPRVFDTYELLEMLLYNTVPVKDTNPISKRLLKQFGSLDGVLSADFESLCEVEGVGAKTAEMITVVGRMLELYNDEHESAEKSTGISTYKELGKYLINYYRDREDKAVLLLSFDNKMELIGVDELYNLDFSSGAIRPAPFLDACVRRSTSVAVLAHNHPFGPLCPTEGDRETNSLIHGALDNIGVFLAEHIIVAGDEYVGFMNHMSTAFAQTPELYRFFGEWRGDVDG